MKKLFLTLALVLVLVFALAACNDTSGDTTGNGGDTAHTHAYGEWVVLKEATATEDGEKVRICACGEKETETIPKTQSGGDNTSGGNGGQSTHTHSWNAENTCTSCGEYKDSSLVFKKTSDSTYAVSDYTGSASELIIPSTYKGGTVTSIANGAFKDCYSLTRFAPYPQSF